MGKKHDYDITTGEGQKRLMYESVGIDITQKSGSGLCQDNEYGHDPIWHIDGSPTGLVKMVPTGRIVDVKTRETVTKEQILKDACQQAIELIQFFCQDESNPYEVLTDAHDALQVALGKVEVLP